MTPYNPQIPVLLHLVHHVLPVSVCVRERVCVLGVCVCVRERENEIVRVLCVCMCVTFMRSHVCSSSLCVRHVLVIFCAS